MPKNHKTVDDEIFPSTNKHRRMNPSSINNVNATTTTSSSSAQEEVVIVHLDFHFRSKLLTNVYKLISKYKINSNIINNDIFLLNEIIHHTKHNSKLIPVPQLLYRGSRDGFKSIDFHSLCDNQGPTLTIIKSANEPNNQIFGGFTTQSWQSPSSYGEWVTDCSAYIFKIDDENKFRKFKIKQDQEYNAICGHKNVLPVFGGRCDICIYSDCNLNNKSLTNFGDTYELPTTNIEFHYGSEKAKNYLAGSYKFKVSEIEVFKIIQ